MRRTTPAQSRRPVRPEVSAGPQRAITPVTLLLAMEQLTRERTLVSQLAAFDVTFQNVRRKPMRAKNGE
jgi:hypothetical protein